MDGSTKTDQSSVVRITVLFFASAREAAGNASRVELELNGRRDREQRPDGAEEDDAAAGATTTREKESTTTTRQLRQLLSERYPKLAPLVLDDTAVTLAVNEEYVLPGQVVSLKDGDTVALIPPISGG